MEERMTNVLDAYMVDSDLSFLDKAKIQAQVLVPLVRALRAALGKEKADALVKTALSDWSRQMFAAIGKDIEGGRRRWAKMQGALNEISLTIGAGDIGSFAATIESSSADGRRPTTSATSGSSPAVSARGASRSTPRSLAS